MTFPFESLKNSLPDLEAEAAENDRDSSFPTAGLACLRDLGALCAPLPKTLGGCGFGTDPGGGPGLLHLLRLTGEGNLSLGRLLEGHINAVRLIARYGTSAQLQKASTDILGGALFGIWVTETTNPVHITPDGATFLLHGEKMFASGALHVTRALITAETPDGETRMLLVPLDANRKASPAVGGLCGMRGAGTGSCDFTGIRVASDALTGHPGDYLRQPEFSAGAWRGMAVALGGIDRLVTLLRDQLVSRARDANPYQRTRIGEALIAQETAALWTRKAALVADDKTLPPGDVAATINLARIAVERAGLDVIERVQRSLGLSAFVKTNVVERIMRDLSTYLRQPAPDETLAEAAGWFTQRDLPQPDLHVTPKP
ncbi:acyl-CoA dehydrogenase family protein [Acetobacter fallax]|uniref:Acyl-CoA dehydrogenase n=1 Tax=Acetobacter fallax TaxID=1737473 RepID=A0ABX0KBT4_9PROT|nr:acyl-CoA dehydrogenase [Acetobacter fallax]NHO31427.1 acyl-CoA dehydrogenase [Acetobacter fallax]NHO34989.1 acyl-CoA dehydrogenase [Acetobacter fallax]